MGRPKWAVTLGRTSPLLEAGLGRSDRPRGQDSGGERPPFSKPASAAVTDQGVRTVGANVPLSRPAKASGRASRAFGARAPEAGRGRPWFDPAVNDLLLLDFGVERPPPWPAVAAVTGPSLTRRSTLC